ncbi:MAG: GAF domain-containing protein [Gammaproteobacteria bacterium]|nr:GAF domain-containing protein [Gammaproteobacteria bacterium]
MDAELTTLEPEPPIDGAIASFLATITLDFASSLDIEEALQHAIDRTIGYLRAEAASIFLLDDASRTLICRKCAGPVDITGLRLSPDQGIVGMAVQTNTIQLVRDVQENTKFAATVDAGTGFVTRSILCVPLAVRGRCIGALEVINKRSGDGLFATADMHLATTVAAAAALAIHNARMAQVMVEQERLRKELELARAIQMSLLPSETNLPIFGLNLPAHQVSGDFYDYFELPDGRIYFSIADVAGKGMNAALLMAKTTSLLRCLAKEIADPAILLAKVNREVYETASLGLFVTIVAGFFDPLTSQVRYANAGHQPPVLWQPTGILESPSASAPPLGVMASLEATTETVLLAGGSFYLFTDGVTEACNAADEALGLEGLSSILDRVSSIPRTARLHAIVAALEHQQRVLHDDLTLLLIETDGT